MIVPLAIFFALGAVVDTEPLRDGQSVNPTMYFGLVIARVVLMSASLVFFGREILRQFPLRTDLWGWGVGVFGAVLWIGVCELGLERWFLVATGLGEDWLPSREGVDPFSTYQAGLPLVGFLLFRFTLLAVCVPIAEELFLRGFVMRAFETEDWTKLPVSQIGRTGLLIGTVYGIATHPGEVVAAALWFSLVSWLMVKTGKFWNCVVAHAVTNLILGLYVCFTGSWQLW